MNNHIFDINYFDEIYSNIIYKDNCELYSKNSKEVFESLSALNLMFKNRFCFSNYADEIFDIEGEVNQSFFEFYQKIAKTNVAMMCTSGLDIEANNNNFCEKNIKIIKDFILELHSSGSKIFLTLKTNRGRVSRVKNAAYLTSASLNREYYSAQRVCLPALDSRCKKLAEKFAIAAKFAYSAGFDGIVIDGSLSNLLGEFTSPELNRRKLGYFSNIHDMPKKIFDKINEKVKKLPIIYKITPFSFFKDSFSASKLLSLRGVKFGVKTDEVFAYFKYLIKLGVDGFMFNFGAIENEFLSQYAPFMGYNIYEKFYNDLEKYLKEHKVKNKFGEDALIIANDNFRSFSCHEDSQRMFEITREIYSDFDFIKNIHDGLPIKNCIRCGICKKVADEKNMVWCAINPTLKHEISNCFIDKFKKVAVVGAGVTGIICASTLATRGFVVDLYEKQDEVNKFGKSCEIFDFDKNLSHFNSYIYSKLSNFAENKKINIKLKTEFFSKNAKDYDVVILAVGFKELFLGVPGAVLKSVASIFDVLTKNIDYKNKKHIAIYAKSELALKLALYLAYNKHDVAVLIKNTEFLMNMPQSLLSYYLIAADKLKIKIIVGCEIKNINEDSVELYVNHKTKNLDFISLISNLRSGKTYKFEPEAKVIDCNLFIYDPDVVPNNRIFVDIVKNGYMGEIYMVGDCLEISDLSEEIKSAYFVGNNV